MCESDDELMAMTTTESSGHTDALVTLYLNNTHHHGTPDLPWAILLMAPPLVFEGVT